MSVWLSSVLIPMHLWLYTSLGWAFIVHTSWVWSHTSATLWYECNVSPQLLVLAQFTSKRVFISCTFCLTKVVFPTFLHCMLETLCSKTLALSQMAPEAPSYFIMHPVKKTWLGMFFNIAAGLNWSLDGPELVISWSWAGADCLGPAHDQLITN